MLVADTHQKTDTDSPATACVPGYVYLSSDAYLLRYLPLPTMQPALVVDYVRQRLPRLHPADPKELAFDYCPAADQAQLIIARQAVLKAVRAAYPSARPVCLVKGFRHLAGDFSRIVLVDGWLELAHYQNGLWRLDARRAYSEADPVKVQVSGFEAALVPGKAAALSFDARRGWSKARFWTLALILAILLGNVVLAYIRQTSVRADEAYAAAFRAASALLQEAQRLETSIKSLEAERQSDTQAPAHPGFLLLRLAGSGQLVQVVNFTYERGRFIVRGSAANAIQLVEYLKADTAFGNLNLTNVQLLPDGREQFSITGVFHDR